MANWSNELVMSKAGIRALMKYIARFGPISEILPETSLLINSTCKKYICLVRLKSSCFCLLSGQTFWVDNAKLQSNPYPAIDVTNNFN